MVKARDGKRNLTLKGSKSVRPRLSRALITGLVRGMANRIPKSLMLRQLAKRIGWPSRALITGLVPGRAKARNGQRNLTLKGSEVLVPGQAVP